MSRGRQGAGRRRCRATGGRGNRGIMQAGTETTPLQQVHRQWPGTRVHIIGVCGSGMSGLARLLLAQGHPVSGSDLVTAAHAVHYVPEGVTLFRRPQRRRTSKADLVVFSSAIAPENPERRAAEERGILCVRRAECLVVLAEAKSAYIVAGSHGKTTTVLDAHPRAAPGGPKSFALHRCAGAAARHERGSGPMARRSWSRPTRATARSRSFRPGQPDSQHRGGASRLLSRHRGDRAGLRHALRAHERPDHLLRRRQERDAALLAREQAISYGTLRSGDLPRARCAAGEFRVALHRTASAASCSAK